MIHLRQVAKDNARVSSQMATESNKRYQDLHAVAANVISVLSPPAPARMTVANRLHTVPPWVLEVATYCICLGVASAMAAA